jgi:FtsP/CotA-like multicopper oxidase with cupredoxin domain
MELESFFDGVGGWSGARGSIAPPIAPGDSFVVAFTPPRAGTFIYHVHGEGGHELTYGLYGPLLVLPVGEPWDPEDDRLLVIADSGQGVRENRRLLVNGSSAPTAWRLTVGRTYRIRVIDIARGGIHQVRISADAGDATWRAVARDGAELPPHQAVTGAARLLLAPGITADFEFTPAQRGALTIEVGFAPPPAGVPVVTPPRPVRIPVIVR